MARSLELISFKLCPFVQRSVITLNFKQVPYNITYIDLDDPPDWFAELSPTGKVPLLKVDGQVLFESAVINEFIDELSPPSLHPQDALQKAKNRAWIEYASELFGTAFDLMTTPSQYEALSLWEDLGKKLLRVENAGSFTPFFNGERFSLIDAAYAPLLMRLAYIRKVASTDSWPALPGIFRWGEALLGMEAVQQSVVPEFYELFASRLIKSNSHLGDRFLALKG